MNGPIDTLRFVHTALEREIVDLERLVSVAKTPLEAAQTKDRFEFLEFLSEGHTRGEEAALFPDLDAKIPSLSRTYLFDHDDERAAFGRIRASLAACGAGDGAAVDPLVREVTKLADHLVRHIRKENELVLPLVHAHFTHEAQAGIIGRIIARFSPADMANVVPFVMAWLEPSDRVRYANVLVKAVPEAALRGLVARIQARLDEASWTALVGDVPALVPTAAPMSPSPP